jgi:hypothetical protein
MAAAMDDDGGQAWHYQSELDEQEQNELKALA